MAREWIWQMSRYRMTSAIERAAGAGTGNEERTV